MGARKATVVTASTDCCSVDTFFAGTLKGVGKVYIQTVLDCFSRFVWARLYTSKIPLTAVQILNNHALPFFEEHGVKVQTILSDNGREYCGRPDKHPYELFLQLEEIEHRTTKVGRPQSNGFIERFHRTLLEEHLRIKGRTTWYEAVDEMQQDLDAYLETYNTRRPHRGRGMEGRTPYEVFKAGKPRKPPTRKKSTRKEVKPAA
jgi:transposase InsO family protein